MKAAERQRRHPRVKGDEQMPPSKKLPPDSSLSQFELLGQVLKPEGQHWTLPFGAEVSLVEAQLSVYISGRPQCSRGRKKEVEKKKKKTGLLQGSNFSLIRQRNYRIELSNHETLRSPFPSVSPSLLL